MQKCPIMLRAKGFSHLRETRKELEGKGGLQDIGTS
jgi:hypothetical protein